MRFHRPPQPPARSKAAAGANGQEGKGRGAGGRACAALTKSSCSRARPGRFTGAGWWGAGHTAAAVCVLWRRQCTDRDRPGPVPAGHGRLACTRGHGPGDGCGRDSGRPVAALQAPPVAPLRRRRTCRPGAARGAIPWQCAFARWESGGGRHCGHPTKQPLSGGQGLWLGALQSGRVVRGGLPRDRIRLRWKAGPTTVPWARWAQAPPARSRRRRCARPQGPQPVRARAPARGPCRAAPASRRCGAA